MLFELRFSRLLFCLEDVIHLWLCHLNLLENILCGINLYIKSILMEVSMRKYTAKGYKYLEMMIIRAILIKGIFMIFTVMNSFMLSKGMILKFYP